MRSEWKRREVNWLREVERWRWRRREWERWGCEWEGERDMERSGKVGERGVRNGVNGAWSGKKKSEN